MNLEDILRHLAHDLRFIHDQIIILWMWHIVFFAWMVALTVVIVLNHFNKPRRP